MFGLIKIITEGSVHKSERGIHPKMGYVDVLPSRLPFHTSSVAFYQGLELSFVYGTLTCSTVIPISEASLTKATSSAPYKTPS